MSERQMSLRIKTFQELDLITEINGVSIASKRELFSKGYFK
jgi:hypothetical protein